MLAVNDDDTYVMGIISGVKPDVNKSIRNKTEMVPKMGVDVSPDFEAKLESVSSTAVKCTARSQPSVSANAYYILYHFYFLTCKPTTGIYRQKKLC